MTCDVYVGDDAEQPDLVVADGATVVFANGAGLYAGHTGTGRLLVRGTDLGVIMTSENASPQPGDWGGLRLGPKSGGSSLRGLVVEYGGSALAGISSTGASILLDGVTARYSATDGFHGTLTSATITNSSFINNGNAGVALDSPSDLVAFENNSLTGNNVGIVLGPELVGRLSSSSTFSGNVTSGVEVRGGFVTSSAVWSAVDVPYHVTGTVYVQDPANPVLTLGDGVQLEFDPAAGLEVASSAAGRLLVDGAVSGVVMRATGASWLGLTMGFYDSGSALNGLVVERGGDNTYGGIHIYQSSPTITRSEVRYSVSDGIHVTSGFPTVSNTVIRDNAGIGFRTDTAGGLALGSTAVATFAGNTLTGNAKPLVMPVRYAGELDPSSSFTGNTVDIIELSPGLVDLDSTWRNLSVPYLISPAGTIDVHSPVAPTLRVEDGVVVLFTPATGINVGYSSSTRGRLEVVGTTDGVRFTSAASIPSPGDWNGLQLLDGSEGSSLVGLTVEYAGANNYGGIYVTYTDVTLDACTVQHNSNHGLFAYASSVSVVGSTFADNSAAGLRLEGGSVLAQFGGSTVAGNGGHAMVISPQDVGALDATSTFSGNALDGVAITSGVIGVDATWHNLGAPYVVQGTIYVGSTAQPTLTVEDGVQVRFNPGTGLTVGQGRLQVDGTNTGVLFTSASSVPDVGDWQGLILYPDDLGSVLQGLTVEYGGSNGYSNIYVVGGPSTPRLLLDNVTSRYSSRAGLSVSGRVVRVSNSAFETNQDEGVYLSSTAALDSNAGPSFVGNVLTGNGGAAIRLGADSVIQLDSSSSFAGNGGSVVIAGGTAGESGTWQALDAPYVVVASIYVGGAAAPTITIQDGAELYFSSNTSLDVGNYAGDGRLMVNGETTGVLFSSASATPTAGDWGGLYVGDHDQGSQLRGLTVEYGGNNGYGNIMVYLADVTLQGVTSRYSSANGISLLASTATISGTECSNNNDDGVYVHSDASLADGTGPTFTNNTLTGNQRPISLPADSVAELDPSSIFTGNTRDEVRVLGSGLVSRSATWQRLDAPYRAALSLDVQGNAAPILTINPGVTILFDAGYGIVVGAGAPGGLLALGTATEPIRFTSSSASPQPGDWSGVYLAPNCVDAQAQIGNAVIDHAGSNTLGALTVSGCDGAIQASTIRSSSSCGIYQDTSPGFSIGPDMTYVGNANGNVCVN
ncbi:MAG: right-handed parallel beta-helix repeat-containing protein [Myxococcota bacterium]